MSEGEGDDIIKFAERVLVLLDRGEFTATYKYAVLLGLIDLCFEHAGSHGEPPTLVTTRQLAEKVLAMYWPHAREFATSGVLLQNKGQQAKILKAIASFRRGLPDPAATFTRARGFAPTHWEALIAEIEWTLVEMPLPRLQVLGAGEDRFIYEIRWRRNEITRGMFTDAGNFDNSIRFVGRAAHHLVRLAGVLRPVLQREWAALVARTNRLPESELEAFLFGATRQAPAALVSDLREIEGDSCFYCRERLADKVQVDHFIPWSRHPDDSIENFVIAHASCNRAKSDHLAAVEHVARWVKRGRANAALLSEIATLRGWEHGGGRVEAIARGIYFNLADGVPVWKGGGEFERFNGPGGVFG